MGDRIRFSKLSGSGNDFILVDNRQGELAGLNLSEVARRLCRRRFSVGADGFIVLEKAEEADFRWQFFNADGSSAEMCGNGGRCAARYAYERGIAGPRLAFETLAGRIRAEVNGRRVKLELPLPKDLRRSVSIQLASGALEGDFLNTGVPHFVIAAADLDGVDVETLGREIRFHPMFAPAGTNVDFIRRSGQDGISIRTYERGVEQETLACGTGAVAGALAASLRWGLSSPVSVMTRGGETLKVHFRGGGAGRPEELFLEGETAWVYDGELAPEALA